MSTRFAFYIIEYVLIGNIQRYTDKMGIGKLEQGPYESDSESWVQDEKETIIKMDFSTMINVVLLKILAEVKS